MRRNAGQFVPTVLVTAAVMFAAGWVTSGPAASGTDRRGKIDICHISPDNPEDFFTIHVRLKDFARHIEHGDFAGTCDDLNLCEPGETKGVSNPCLVSLLADPEVMAILNNPELVPSLADGRLHLDEITRELRLGDAVPAGARGDEADPGRAEDLSRALIAELSSSDPLRSVSEVFTNAGPIPSQSFVPLVAGDFPFAPLPDNPNYLDIAGFTWDLHDALSPNVNGYAMRMRMNGSTVSTLQWEWARNPNFTDAPPAGWNTNRRIHIVSLSKFMSAIGLVHLLRANDIPTTAKIIDYLPDYWTPGPNVGLIDFEHLMNHVSGFSTGSGSSSNWATMESVVEGGVNASDVGSFPGDYENLNFGLLRIMIAVIGGYIHPSTDFGFEFLNDIW